MLKTMLKLFVLLLLITSCAPTIKDFAKYQKTPTLRSDLFDLKDLKKKKASVVILDFNENEIKLAEKISLGSNLARNIENYLAASKIVDLKDRAAFPKFKRRNNTCRNKW